MRTTLVIAAAIGAALNGGVLFAFSSFVMPALHRLDPPAAITAMQSINVTAVRPPFMPALLGTAALTVVTVILGLRQWPTPAGKLLVAGSAVYLIGVIGLTMAYHVPLNNALATADPTASDAARTWADYSSGWTALNHVRATAGVLASALLIAAQTTR
jgi:uncharacterized membrane protein